MKQLVVTAVGSRKINKRQREEASMVSEYLANKGWVFRSGGAIGSDYAFETGVRASNNPKNLEIYLANCKTLNLDETEYIPEILNPMLFSKALEMVSKIHPAVENLTWAAMKLHARNMYQVLGINLDRANKSDLLICYAPGKFDVVQGGTATAWNLAKLLGILRFNLTLPGDRAEFERLYLPKGFLIHETMDLMEFM